MTKRKGRQPTHGMRYTTIYRVWSHMKGRCNNPNDSHYKWYGGKGISVCDRWKTFPEFYEDMGDVPKGMTLDRIDNNKGYSPDNCKWSTRLEQARNKSNSLVYTVKGKTMRLKEWAEFLETDYLTLYQRIKKLNWSIEKALDH